MKEKTKTRKQPPGDFRQCRDGPTKMERQRGELDRAERAIWKSEDHYRTLVELSPNAVAVHAGGRLVFVNSAAVTLLGATSPDQLIGRSMLEFVHPDYRDIIRKRVEQLTKAGVEVPLIEEKFIRLDGTNVEVEVAAISIMYRNRPAVQVVARDITERKRAEKALRKSEEKLRTMFESTREGILISGPEGRITSANPALAAILGYESPLDLVGKRAIDLYTDPGQRSALFRQLMNKGYVNECELGLLRKDGAVVHVLGSATIHRDREGNILRTESIFRDITERKQAEHKLREAKERAEVSDRLKNAFLSTMSHEVRTPLNALLGYSNILASDLAEKLSDEQKKFFRMVQEAGTRLKRLMDDILDISRIEADRTVLNIQPAPGDALVSRAVSQILLVSGEKKLKVVERFQAPGVCVRADKERLHQALGNILFNAVKFTPRGSITIATKGGNGQYEIEIADTGIGIADEFRPHLFSLFRQEGDGYHRAYEGPGLGLAIAHRLVTAMDGRIEVKSEQGKGATFTVFLPTVVESTIENNHKTCVASAPDETDPHDEKDGKEGETVKGNILIVEDNQANLRYTEYVVKKLGHTFISAESGEKAIELLEKESVDGMLADIALGEGMSGTEFMKRVKKERRFKDVPIIAVTAHAMKGQREKFLDEGFDDYIPKPFRPEVLNKVLNRNLKKNS